MTISQFYKSTCVVLLSTMVLGCSGGDDDPSGTQTPVANLSASPMASEQPDSGQEIDGPNPNGQNSPSSAQDGSPRAGSERDLGAEFKLEESKHRVTMNIEDGVKREFQNGPTADELKAIEQRYKRKKGPRKVYKNTGSDAPLYGDDIVEITP